MLLSQPLSLPCGSVLPNRLAKGAMTEGLADPRGRPTPELERLYGLWSDGGAGLLITGNVPVDRDHLERPGNVILDRAPSPGMMTALRKWAQAGTRGGNQLWMQLSHAGRQTPIAVNRSPKAPSATSLTLPGGRFGDPVPLTTPEIQDLKQRFVVAALAAAEAGFTGVQIHAAHGYLLSQFLSPRTNRRRDAWGGGLEGRARLLMQIVQDMRAAVGPAFPISVKLNSADFQRGGFALADSVTVAQWLEEAGVDLLEVSGGSYEQPAMMGVRGIGEVERPVVRASTAAREAYFLDFAEAMRSGLKNMPLMVTGGFRTAAAMENALAARSADVIGIGRPLCVSPSAFDDLIAGSGALARWEERLALLPGWLRWLERSDVVRAASGFGVQMWYYAQLDHLGRHGQSRESQSVLSALRQVRKHERRWLAARRSQPPEAS